MGSTLLLIERTMIDPLYLWVISPPPPKGDPVFELKQLPDTLKYAYQVVKKIYPVIISVNLSEIEEKVLLKT